MMRPKLLMLVHRVPIAPDRGDRVRSFHLLRFLASYADIYLAALADEPLGADDLARIRPWCQQLAVTPLGNSRWLRAACSVAAGHTATEGLFHSSSLKRTVDRWNREIGFDAALVFCSSMVQFIPPELPPGRVVVDLVDVDSQKWADYEAHARWPSTMLFRLEAARLRRLERDLAHRAATLTLVSDAEAEICASIAPSANVVAVPNGVDVQYFSPAHNYSSTPCDCVFVGALDYRANIDAVVWFCHEVWPKVLAARRGATLAVVGRNPTTAVKRLSTIAGVRIVGQVPDVRPYLSSAKIAIAPLRIARGIQNKVLEAAGLGKAMVVSPSALEGLQLRPGHELEVAVTPDDWACKIARLLVDAERRRELGTAARQFVIDRHSWEACLAPFTEILFGQPATIKASIAADAGLAIGGTRNR